jgi:hypothetical protein
MKNQKLKNEKGDSGLSTPREPGLESPAERFVGRSRGLHGKFMELEPYRIPIGARPNIIKHFIFWGSFLEI